MANSQRYIQLEKRIRVVESLYLPPIRPSGNYTPKEQDDVRAYLLLVHAEIESYFEEISEKKAKEAFRKWKSTIVVPERMRYTSIQESLEDKGLGQLTCTSSE